MAQASASREMGRLREAFVARLRRSVRLLSRQHEKVHGAAPSEHAAPQPSITKFNKYYNGRGRTTHTVTAYK